MVDDRPWPILGRPQLEARLRDALEAGNVYLIGEPGSGKTVLALRAIEKLGIPVLHLRGTALSAEVPYGTLQSVLSAVDDAELGNPLTVVRALRQALEARLGPGPSLVLADNAHQIDEASAHVLALLAESGSARLLIAGTSVLDGPRAFAELWRDQLVRTVEVPPFTPDEVAQLATLYLGGPAALSAITLAGETTGGNPLYLHYLLTEWLDTAALELHEGVWALAGSGELSSPRFADLVATQLGRWTGTRREALELVALTEEFPVALLLQLVDADDLDAVERAGIVVIDNDGSPTARIRNRFVAQLIKQGIPFGRRRSLRERVLATGIDPESWNAEQRLAFAVWTIESGVALAPEFAAHAAETALELYDPALALRIAATVPEGAQFARASVARAVALRYLGLREHAARALGDVDAGQRARLEPALIVALAVEEAAVLSSLEGRADDALAALEAARLAVAASASASDDLLPLESALDVARFEVELGLGHHRELLGPLDEAYRRGPESGLARWAAASAMYAETLAIVGRQQEALRIVSELGEVDDSRLDRATTAVVRSSLFGCLLKCGLWDDALGIAGSSPSTGRESLVTSIVAETVVGTLHLYSGRAGAALPALLSAHSQTKLRDLYLRRGQIVASLAWATALLGDSTEARRYLDLYGDGHYAPFTSAVAAELAVVSARLALGEELEAPVLARADALLADGQVMDAVLLLAGLARRGSAPAVERLRSGLVEQPGPLAVAIVDFAHGTAEGDAELLLRSAELLAHLGNDGFAAQAAAAATAVPDADRSTVRRAQQLAKDARKRLGSASSSAPEKLSARESEVAELAARRLTNQEIADRLHLSVRTVESYLQSAFGKLGINSRADLPDVLEAIAAS